MSIDGTNPDNFTGRVLDEKQTRANILNWAKVMGDNYLYKDIVLLFEKYDKLIRLCKNDKEVKLTAKHIIEDIRGMTNHEAFALAFPEHLVVFKLKINRVIEISTSGKMKRENLYHLLEEKSG